MCNNKDNLRVYHKVADLVIKAIFYDPTNGLDLVHKTTLCQSLL